MFARREEAATGYNYAASTDFDADQERLVIFPLGDVNACITAVDLLIDPERHTGRVTEPGRINDWTNSEQSS